MCGPEPPSTSGYEANRKYWGPAPEKRVCWDRLLENRIDTLGVDAQLRAMPASRLESSGP